MPPRSPTSSRAPGHLVLTGAGMSTDSGIPDYRGPDGTRRVTPMQHGEFVGSGEARQRYWARSFIGWQRFTHAEPNAAHRAVADLQRRGALGAVITQNVDGLHQAAGQPRRHRAARHPGRGRLPRPAVTAPTVTCSRPGWPRRTPASRGWPGARRRTARGSAARSAPTATSCSPTSSSRGSTCRAALVCGADTLKPDVVFFGGSVPRDRVDACYALTDAAPALLVLGSSLAVMSGLRFVRHAAEARHPRHGGDPGPDRAVTRS